MTQTIYVVIGATGEYSDRLEWLVEAYPSEDAARARVVELEDLARSHRGMPRDKAEKAMRKHPRGDRRFRTDYTDTRYRYQPVQLEEAKA